MERDEKDKSIVRLSLTVLVDDNICREGLLGAHGLSLFLSLVDRQGEKYHILFDVGPDSELLKINSEILGLNLR
ncbi:MAG TPA: MBL fold metallo-hydrolase, partial [Thermofilum sp.]|nr:MBL fold metallo-hydrolase [Thermofilum sp.]